MGRRAKVRMQEDTAEPARRGGRPLENSDPQIVVWRGVNGRAVRFGGRPDVLRKRGPRRFRVKLVEWSRRTDVRIHREEGVVQMHKNHVEMGAGLRYTTRREHVPICQQTLREANRRVPTSHRRAETKSRM
jgi:hypothetical protein